MEEVIVSAPVQERLDMEVDKVEGDAKLAKVKKPKRRQNRRSKNKVLAKGEDTENPNTSAGAIASADQPNGDTKDVTTSRDICSPAATADQKMIVPTPAAVDRKSSVKNMKTPDKTSSLDILSPAATADKQVTVLSPAPVQECSALQAVKDEVATKLTRKQKKYKRKYLKIKQKKKLESLDKREGTENSGSLGAIASVDQIVSGDTLSTKVHEAVSGETVSGMTVTDVTPSKKRKRNQSAKKTVAGDAVSAKVDEVVSGEMVLGKTTVTDNPTPKKRKNKKNKKNKKKKKVAGDVLSAQVDEIVSDDTTQMKNVPGDVLSTEVHELVNGETVPSQTTTNNTTPKKKRRNKKKRELTTVAGDVSSTCENIQGKVNAIDGSSAAEVTEALPDVKTVSKEEVHTEAANGKMESNNVNGAANSSRTIEETLTSQNLQNLKADNGETVSGTTAADTAASKKRKKGKNKKKNPLSGDILSENMQDKVNAIDGSSATEVTEAASGEMVSKEEVHTEAANGKMESSATTNVNGAANSSLTTEETLTPQNLPNLKADNGETGSGTTAADTTASKKRKRGKNKNKNLPLGETLSTTKVLDTKAVNELSDITNRNVDGKKGPEVVNREIGTSNTTSKQKSKKQKVDVLSSEIKEIAQATPGKKLIIFDVNGMLADIVCPRPRDVEADKYTHGKAVFKRPYLDDFLSFCFENFNVAIWSSRMKKNLDPVVDCLFGDLKKKLLFIWDHSHCRNSGMRTLEDRYKCIVFKELQKVWKNGSFPWVVGTFNESNTLLLDDSPYKALLNPKHTGIFPISYKYTDTDDDYLGPTGALRAYLEGFAAADDGRAYVEQNPFGEGAIDANNQDWKYYSRVLKGQKEYCISRGMTYINVEE